MKILYYIFILLISLSISAQKKVLKEVDFNNQNIEVQFEDIDLLEIVRTEDQKISISMVDYVENTTQLEIENVGNNIRIISKSLIPFEPNSKIEKFCYLQPLFPSYKLSLPKGSAVEISYKNGNIEVVSFTGNMDLRLNTGDVKIDDFKGSITTELLFGNINATIRDTEVNIISNHGDITTTFPSEQWQKTDISLKGILGINNNLLKVESISANINLKTIETQ
ncbi:DUF4097 family beta strand repeat protein [Aureibaculum sp. A20]|uniref:DUF4097 family beta strand repeat protein n=1 Tax=Aureibaculum flavum TaxID=2795986 RepID=A0ABS0WWY6_9FLAO|nr:DUF4097 family beta strand repeat-containing protein [Aureibaculum flavum]MBJ2176425.1 DUF4097 family beta strand repeat protein [Aureibaculum flavum]